MSFKNMQILGGKYLKIKSGDVIDLHVLTEDPKRSIVHGFGNMKKECTGIGCLQCNEGNMPKQRWTINVFDRREHRVKLWEFGPVIARQLRAIAEMLEDTKQKIHDVDLRIKAEGSGINKEYTVLSKPMAAPIPENIELYELP